jgi:hypothetical protein
MQCRLQATEFNPLYVTGIVLYLSTFLKQWLSLFPAKQIDAV